MGAWASLRALPAGTRWALALFAVLCYFPLFLHLDTLPARLFDESRQALSALEMLRSGDWLVTHYQGEVDLYNTKPPLLFWLIATSYAVFGPGELAMRLPVAFLALATCAVLMRSVWRVTGSPWAGLYAVLILLTCGGYVTVHVARTADFDAPMIFFMFTSMVLLHRWSRGGQGRLVLWSLCLLTLGAFTKSVQAMLYVPGIIVALAWERKLLGLLRMRWFYFGLGFFVLIIGGFLLLREQAAPGYLHAVLYNDVTGRVGEALDDHAAPPEFYFKLLHTWQFGWWWWLSIMGATIGLVHRNDELRSWTRWLVCISVCYLIAISSAQTKMEWYSAPLLPLLAALAALPIHLLIQWLQQERYTDGLLRVRVLPITVAMLIFLVPYATVLGKVYKPKENEWDWTTYDCAYAMRRWMRSEQGAAADIFCFQGDQQHLNFQLALLGEQGINLPSGSDRALRAGDRVMISQPAIEKDLTERYHLLLLEARDAMRIYQVLGPK